MDAAASRFESAWQLVQQFEGGGRLVDDPNDPGGLTKFGISHRAYPKVDIASLTEDQARELARQDYWIRAGCDRVPWWLAIPLFDAAFNQGAPQAIRILQQSLGVPVDGIFGPETQEAAQHAYPTETLTRFLAERAVAYSYLAPAFRLGWFSRLFRLQRAIGGLTA